MSGGQLILHVVRVAAGQHGEVPAPQPEHRRDLVEHQPGQLQLLLSLLRHSRHQPGHRERDGCQRGVVEKILVESEPVTEPGVVCGAVDEVDVHLPRLPQILLLHAWLHPLARLYSEAALNGLKLLLGNLRDHQHIV